jgi:serine phosphatase RsbU (regulator of sigma subunit)
MPPNSTLLTFTDGLVERRDEDLTRGMERLQEAATAPEPSLDESLTRILSTMTPEGSEDDIAILAFRWSDLSHQDPRQENIGQSPTGNRTDAQGSG